VQTIAMAARAAAMKKLDEKQLGLTKASKIMTGDTHFEDGVLPCQV
jgi:hypothetical protein